MDAEHEKQILDELRRQTELLRRSHRANVSGMVAALLLLLVFLAGVSRREGFFHRRGAGAIDSWSTARGLLDNGDTVGGTAMIRRLIAKQPNYYYGYRLLGSVEQQAGNMGEAEADYAKACELFPSEENQKVLTAIQKAIVKASIKQATPTNTASAAGATPGSP